MVESYLGFAGSTDRLQTFLYSKLQSTYSLQSLCAFATFLRMYCLSVSKTSRSVDRLASVALRFILFSLWYGRGRIEQNEKENKQGEQLGRDVDLILVFRCISRVISLQNDWNDH